MAINIKKILIMGDDPRVPSGVGTQLRFLGKGLVQRGYEIIVLGGLRKRNPDDKNISIVDGMKVYPVEGYGNPTLLRNILTVEQPDAMILFTDPRYWIWVWRMEDEIRNQIPIIYYNLWDDSPIQPNHYNKTYYQSCDGLIQISKQTNVFMHNIFLEDDTVEFITTENYNNVLNSSHEKAGMQIYRRKDE